MKTSIKTKKGFTVVELVIVIAVIAILAAVLIPTFINLVNKANVSADVQLVRNLNTALALDKTENGKHDTMHDAVHAVKEHGFDVTLIKPTTEGFYILWDSVNDVFCYAEDGEGKTVNYVPEDIVTDEQKQTAKESVINFYYVDDKVSGFEHNYSIYYNGDATEITVIDRNFDAGHSQINVTVDAKDKELRVRTYGGALAVKDGTVTVYGFVRTFTKTGGKVIAAAGTMFHDAKENVVGIDEDQGALYSQHLYNSENKCYFCDMLNPDHDHIGGEFVTTDIDETRYKVTMKCTLCDCVLFEQTFEKVKGDKETVIVEVPGEKEIIKIEVPGETVIENCKHESYSEWRELTEANCTTPGVQFKYCKKCGHTEFKTTEVLGHDYRDQKGQDATCTVNGYKDYQKCSRCSAVKGYEVIKATGHDMSVVVDAKAKSCTEDGWNTYHKCSVCGEKDTDYVLIKAGHDLETIQAKEPTCTEDGHNQYQQCKNCTYNEGKEDIKAAHNHGADGFCTNGDCHHYSAIPDDAEIIKISGYDITSKVENDETDKKTYYYRLTQNVELSVKEFVEMFGVQCNYPYPPCILDELYFDLNGYMLTIKTSEDDYDEDSISNIALYNTVLFANGSLNIPSFGDLPTNEAQGLFVMTYIKADDARFENKFCIYNVNAICQRGPLASVMNGSHEQLITKHSQISGGYDWIQ